MTAKRGYRLVAVDIGNSRIKLGRFADLSSAALPEPLDTLHLAGDEPALERLGSWLGLGEGISKQEFATSWWIGSVNRPSAARLQAWIAHYMSGCDVRFLAAADLPLRVAVAEPDAVGIDRLLDAVAANAIRPAGRAAVVVDIGSAVTVDFVSPDGVFRGGAIAPGLGMSARALHAFTDLLPLVDVTELTSAPPALGTSTVDAMRSGLFWGVVGSIRQLTERLTLENGVAQPPSILLTGGAAAAVAALLGPDASHVPNLTLTGIALAARSARS